MPKTKILVVDDEAAIREALEMLLQEWGFDVRPAADGEKAKQLVETYDPDIVVSDVVLPQLSGLELLRLLKIGNPSRPVILITAHATVDLAVEAMKQGAYDFVNKPLDYTKLRSILHTAQKELDLRKETQKLSSQLEKGFRFAEFVGTSSKMREVYELIRSVSASDASVLITGESGTGKELVARTIHQSSSRSDKPFIAINAAAIPETLIESEIFGHERGAFTGAVAVRAGCFELAHQGTLFLDEIAEMPLSVQPKLLRVLEDGRVRRLGGRQEFELQVRLITATNRDPSKAVEEGQLREDLFYRLNVFTIPLPSLRERKEDIPLLTRHFTTEFNRKHKTAVVAVRDEAMAMLKSYFWPGNVRELRNVMERAVILAKGEWIEVSHLPPYMREPAPAQQESIVIPFDAKVAEVEKALILKVLKRTGNNKAEAARQLGLDVKTIRNKLKSYNMGSD